ncbi:MAG: inositol-3-phosphate synthase [Cyanobacteria bacterium P01_A01_bin.17]
MANTIKIAIVGLGNCASALLQGIEYYRCANEPEVIGLMNWELGGYQPGDIQAVCAFDIDQRKVGYDINEAIFAAPNCTTVFCGNMPKSNVNVSMGCVLDGCSGHMSEFPEAQTFVKSQHPEPSLDAVVQKLQDSGAEILINYLPVGSEQATQFYAECALKARVAFINCIPAFIASNPSWAERFQQAKLPIIGDDIKSQVGATITHRVLSDLFKKRGVKVERTYQLNTGGNTDFLNMTNRSRLASKKVSKTEAVQSALAKPLESENIHVGPSDYVPWQKDNKVAFIRIEGKLFGNVPMHLEMRLSVEDSPNSAGVVIDAIRCCKVALDRNIGGALLSPSAYFMKHPPKQLTDEEAYLMTQKFADGEIEQ